MSIKVLSKYMEFCIKEDLEPNLLDLEIFRKLMKEGQLI